jgi:hypothetical protein
VHAFRFGGKEICHAARTAQLHADGLSLSQSAIVCRRELAFIDELVTLPTGKNPVFVEYCDAASAAPHWAAKPSPPSAIVARRPFDVNGICFILPRFVRAAMAVGQPNTIQFSANSNGCDHLTITRPLPHELSPWAEEAVSLPTSNVQTSIGRGRLSAAVPA